MRIHTLPIRCKAGDGRTLAGSHVASFLGARTRGRESPGDFGNRGNLFAPKTGTAVTYQEVPHGRVDEWGVGCLVVCDVRPCPTTVASQPSGCPWTAARCVSG